MPHLSRREFLKIAGISSTALLVPKLRAWANPISMETTPPNIIIVLFDAMSARNLSVYGYPRETSSHLERFAAMANVYHSHYAGGNFTTPGTASLLTGTYPWSHRAINYRGQIQSDMVKNNLFAALGKQYTRLAFPQNFWANLLLTQFQDEIEVLLSSGSFSELNLLINDYFSNDRNMTSRALDDFVFKLYGFKQGAGRSGTLFLGSLESWLYASESERLPYDGYRDRIPFIPDYPVNFRLEKVFDGLITTLNDLPQPFFAYFHLLPPHEPYIPTNRFFNEFKTDEVKFLEKPEHPLSRGHSERNLRVTRRFYDEYIASADHEFGRFFNFLRDSGFLENSYVIVTSDHGEMFERGEVAHATPLLYDPVVHIPLMIHSPGQETRRDFHVPTSAVDILPTLATIAGKPIPEQAQGRILPGLTDEAEDFNRSIFVVEAKTNPARSPLKNATVSLRKGNHKMIYYTGYKQEDMFELYDLETDLEEMQNLYPENPSFTKSMKEELLEALHTADSPYMRE